MKFTKMQGAGNDYVYVNCFEEEVADPSAAAIRVSDRHFGIGSDGLILICPSDCADVRMRMFNADGSEGEMCGNGVRCVAKYAYDHQLVHSEKIDVETLGGIKHIRLRVKEGRAVAATVDMGQVKLTSELPEKITVDGREREFIGIDVGNPHAVYYEENVKDLPLASFGPAYERHPRFPKRVNSEFVRVIDRTHLEMRVWERGSGETMACGTGATACAVASMMMGYTEDETTVHLLGGDLIIRWDRESGHAFMTGPAVEVFHGEIDL